jgi:transcriptional regulator with XRE-family HTH domain
MKFEQLLKTVGNNLKKARTAKGLTQFDMTDYGFSRRQYQYIESGQRNITLSTLHRLAGIFGTQPDKLLKK